MSLEEIDGTPTLPTPPPRTPIPPDADISPYVCMPAVAPSGEGWALCARGTRAMRGECLLLMALLLLGDTGSWATIAGNAYSIEEIIYWDEIKSIKLKSELKLNPKKKKSSNIQLTKIN